ncbi:Cytochrome c-type biogenesis protein CcmG/DsbE, thiol:disulfide oxidoreductase [hydrothermal vent metagenome]|uniref:Cytochrome c-type biogenesis protein CcmG/DsbE, thiol:disulfide oxidoreductase n=1 Tax=hydrothermal vent metagenome TaxID=652676 RepID=A0A1W1BWK4_9ZZZZ
MKRFIPLIIFSVLVIFLYISLWLNPKELPSPFIGKPFPNVIGKSFENKTFSLENLKGKVSLVNVWASWCVTCRAEHKILMRISKESSVQMIGVNYKDNKKDALEYLNELGNPFQINVFDELGAIGLELGVYATPETFIVDKEGIIRYKHIGEITIDVWDKEIKKIIADSY